MVEVNVTWNDGPILVGVATAVTRAMGALGPTMAGTIRTRIAAPYPPASRPGQPPHRRSGGLSGAIGSRVTHSTGEVSLAVGVPAAHRVAAQARALQGGTRNMEARPFLGEIGSLSALVVAALEAEVATELARR